MPLPSPSAASLQALARAAVNRALRQWPAGRRFVDDLEQEAVLAALGALRSWDPTQSSWSTWAWWAMKTALRRYLLGNVGPLSQPDSKRQGGDAPRVRGARLSYSLASPSLAPDVRAMALQALGALIRAARASLGPSHRRSPCGLSFEAFVDRDLEVFVRAALGEPIAVLAKSVGLSRQAAHISLCRVRALNVA